MNSKGFRDEDGNIITIPGSSVRYNSALNGRLAKFGADGFIEDGGDMNQFAPKNHTHPISEVAELDAALGSRMKNTPKEVILEVNQSRGFDLPNVSGAAAAMANLWNEVICGPIWVNIQNHISQEQGKLLGFCYNDSDGMQHARVKIYLGTHVLTCVSQEQDQAIGEGDVEPDDTTWNISYKSNEVLFELE